MAIQVEEFIQKIDGMSVLELNNLVKALEEHYGVLGGRGGGAGGGGGRCGGQRRRPKSRPSSK